MTEQDSRFAATPGLTGFEGGETAPTLTIPRLVARNALAAGDRVAFRALSSRGNTEWTWSEVESATREIAAGLMSLDLAERAPGLIIGSGQPEYFIAEYAIQSLGGIAFPLFEKMSSEEMSETLTGYGTRIAFSGGSDHTEALLGAAHDLGLERVIQWGSKPQVRDERVLSLDSLREIGRNHLQTAASELDALIAGTRLDDVACIILTSGTTGVPKGVLGTHRYMLDIAARYAHLYAAEPFDRYLSYLPAAFSVEQYCTMTMGAALPLEVTFAESPETIDRDFVTSDAQFRFLGPRQWEGLRSGLPASLVSDPSVVRSRRQEIRTKLGLDSVKAGISAGGSLSREVFEFFRDVGVDIKSVYGFAETGIITGTKGGDDLDTVGAPLPSPYGQSPIDVRIADNGEILIRGGVRCADYWGDKNSLDLTEDGWLRSGDAGTWDGKALRVIDRIGNMQQLPDGTMFAPQPVEISLCRSPYISNVLLVAGHRDDSRIGALLEINERSIRERLFTDRPSVEYADIVRDPLVIELLSEEVRALGENEGPQISMMGVLPKPLSSDHGELTRSMKLRRKEVLRRYEPLVDAMYTPTGEVISFDLYIGRENEGSYRPVSTRVAGL